MLFAATVLALVWENSAVARAPTSISGRSSSCHVGVLVDIDVSLHFFVNEVLMTLFFFVVGLEIRREAHDGALASLKLAALPVAAAVGGVAAPALIYFGISGDTAHAGGWAVPTATDIAFAVGVLALLGKRVPPALRALLLALAIADDVAAIVIIAVVFAGGVSLIGPRDRGGRHRARARHAQARRRSRDRLRAAGRGALDRPARRGHPPRARGRDPRAAHADGLSAHRTRRRPRCASSVCCIRGSRLE